MARRVFDFAESPGSGLQEQPRVVVTQFGDGYAHRQEDGLNAIAQVWDMRFRNVERGPGDEIIQFFRDHRGVTPFLWTPRWSSAPILVICPNWSRTQPEEHEISDISAKFQQVFEP